MGAQMTCRIIRNLQISNAINKDHNFLRFQFPSSFFERMKLVLINQNKSS